MLDSKPVLASETAAAAYYAVFHTRMIITESFRLLVS